MRDDSQDKDNAWSAFLARSRDLAMQIVHVDDPYDLGNTFMGALADVVTVGPYAGELYVLWGALTDRFELRPDKDSLAAEHMRSAAREWLALDPFDNEAASEYLIRWLAMVGVKDP